MFKRIKHVHFVGIGGIGMSGIAEVLLNLGYKVIGSDVRATEITKRLEGLGASVYPRHAAENVKGAHVVVTSSAVHSDNPEILEAQRAKIPVIARAEMLAELERLGCIASDGDRGPWLGVVDLRSASFVPGPIERQVVLGRQGFE